MYLENVSRRWSWFVLRPFSFNDLINFLLGLRLSEIFIQFDLHAHKNVTLLLNTFQRNTIRILHKQLL